MWLRDFLPEEDLNARIMTFNHNTQWEGNALSKSLHHHGDDLLRALRRVRQTPEVKHNSLGTLRPHFANKHSTWVGEQPADHLHWPQLWGPDNQAGEALCVALVMMYQLTDRGHNECLCGYQ